MVMNTSSCHIRTMCRGLWSWSLALINYEFTVLIVEGKEVYVFVCKVYHSCNTRHYANFSLRVINYQSLWSFE